MTETVEPEFITAAQLSRKADLPLSRVYSAINGGLLVPDAIPSPNLKLFKATRIDEARRICSTWRASSTTSR